MNKTLEECRKVGYITTILGRKRYFPEMKSSNAHEVKKAERQAINTVCQG